MNVVIYARFSSSGQREESIEGQVKVCTEYAENNDYTVIGTYVDRALTGRMINDQICKDCYQIVTTTTFKLLLYILQTVLDVICSSA